MAKKPAPEIRPDEAIRLEEARVARGFADAKAAATYFGWKYSTYSQHERGERGLRMPVAKKYAKALRTSPGWLKTGEGTPPNGLTVADVTSPRGTADKGSPDSPRSPALDERPLISLAELAIEFALVGMAKTAAPDEVRSWARAAVRSFGGLQGHPDHQD